MIKNKLTCKDLKQLGDGEHSVWMTLYMNDTCCYNNLGKISIKLRDKEFKRNGRLRPKGEIISLAISEPDIAWAEYSYSHLEDESETYINAEEYTAQFFKVDEF